MDKHVYSHGDFIVFKTGSGYVVYNMSKPFETGHTHIRNRKSAIDAVNFVIYSRIPKRTSDYYLLSLIRLSTDEKYIEHIQSLRDTRKAKGRKPQYRRAII